jgi:hypothetical protein
MKQFDPAGKPFMQIPVGFASVSNHFPHVPNGVLMDGVTAVKLAKLMEENERLRKENEKLRKENEQFNNILADLTPDDAFFVPSFPQDFTFYGSTEIGDGLSDDDIQDLIVAAHESAQYLENGQFTMVNDENVAVIVLRYEDKLITVVAEDYYENELEIEIDDSEDSE